MEEQLYPEPKSVHLEKEVRRLRQAVYLVSVLNAAGFIFFYLILFWRAS